MRRTRAIKWIMLMALVTAIGPMLAAVLYARHQGLQAQLARVSSYAEIVVDRSDRAVDQMMEVVAILGQEYQARAGDSCSPAMLARMRELGVVMEYIKVAGFVRDDRLLCSTLGISEPSLDIGPVQAVALDGTRIRYTSPAPQSNIPYVSLERDGFIAMAQRNQAVDLVVDQEGVLFGTFDPDSQLIRTSNGEINAEWLRRSADSPRSAFVADGYIVGVVRSQSTRFTGAIAAVPAHYLDQAVQEFIFLLLPLALIAGVGFSASFLYFARQQTSLTHQIRQGLKRNEFFLVYQPVVEIATGQWQGVEALVRWRHPQGDIVMPDVFIPVAEHSEVIGQLTARVFELVERDVGALLTANPDFYVAINLSAQDLQTDHALFRLKALKHRLGLQPGQLMVEVTERMLLNPDSAARSIQALRSAGIPVAIDDFGTGYCSLSYLEQMDFDVLKIDRLFVDAIDRKAVTSPVILYIIEMARTLGLKIVAEGVETPEQAAYLSEFGVHLAQGWLYSRPISADLLRSRLSLR